MKNLVKMTLLTTLMISCNVKVEARNNKKVKNKLKCTDVSTWIKRCENKEVICYTHDDTRSGFSCYFKNYVKLKDAKNALSDSLNSSN